MSGELEKFVQQNRDAFDDRVPAADMFSRIQEKMSEQPVKEVPAKALINTELTLYSALPPKTTVS